MDNAKQLTHVDKTVEIRTAFLLLSSFIYLVVCFIISPHMINSISVSREYDERQVRTYQIFLSYVLLMHIFFCFVYILDLFIFNMKY